MALDERHEKSMLEELPIEVMTHILDFLDISSRLHLARGNLALQQRVYRDCSGAWKIVDFVGTDCRKRLTDLDLSRFLTRINAVETVFAISLRGCALIEGSGLSPLRNSKELVGIFLEDTAVENNPCKALWVLRSMFPFKLQTICFPRSYIIDPDGRLMDFLRNFREARLEKVKNDVEYQCYACELPLMEATRQLVPALYGYQGMSCDSCGHGFCRRSSCSVDVKECCACFLTICSDCKCRKVSQCVYCAFSYCHSCQGMEECAECGNASCCNCAGVNECNYCKRNVCQDCTGSPEPCKKECSLCSACHLLGRCSQCNEEFCIGCVESSRQCSLCFKVLCDKSSCRQQTFECLSCDVAFCKDCKVPDHCSECETTFCMAHNRLVDCKSCETRHCRVCGHERPCKYCGTSCYEDCVCSDEKPAKRAKKS